MLVRDPLIQHVTIQHVPYSEHTLNPNLHITDLTYKYIDQMGELTRFNLDYSRCTGKGKYLNKDDYSLSIEI